MQGFELITSVRFQLISWKDSVSLQYPISSKFDHLRVNWFQYTTATTGLQTMSLRVRNLKCNNNYVADVDGTAYDYMFSTVLDPGLSANIYVENRSPPQKIKDNKHVVYSNFDYEIYVNDELSSAHISVSNPVFVEIEFLKKM